MDRPGINSEPFTLTFDEAWGKANATLYYNSIVDAINNGNMGLAIEKICRHPEWFTIYEPVQDGDKFIYNIEVHL
jgi:hypothetical protein